MTSDYAPSAGCSCGQQFQYQRPNSPPCNCGYPNCNCNQQQLQNHQPDNSLRCGHCGNSQCTCGANIPFLPAKPTCCGMPGCSCMQNSEFYNPKKEVETIPQFASRNPKEQTELIYGFEMRRTDPATHLPCGGCGACEDCLNAYRNYRTKRAIKRSSENKLKKYAAAQSFKKEKSKSIMKRDINYEYKDASPESEYPTDFSIPEIIQYMPETLLPNFERGQCMFGNKQPTVHKRYATDEVSPAGHRRLHEFEVDPSKYRNGPAQADSFYVNQGETFSDSMPFQVRMGEQFEAQPQHQFDFRQYEQDPILGAPQPSQNPRYQDPKLDHLVKQIIYSHPDFIEANNHGIPGPSLAPSEEKQEEEISDFFTKLVRGRIGQMMGEEQHQQYGHYNSHHHHQNPNDRYYREAEDNEEDLFGV